MDPKIAVIMRFQCEYNYKELIIIIYCNNENNFLKKKEDLLTN